MERQSVSMSILSLLFILPGKFHENGSQSLCIDPNDTLWPKSHQIITRSKCFMRFLKIFKDFEQFFVCGKIFEIRNRYFCNPNPHSLDVSSSLYKMV